jgi:hypothetical protein
MSAALTLSGAGAPKFLRDLTATFKQLAPPWTIVRIIVDGIEDRSGLEQLGSGGYVERV